MNKKEFQLNNGSVEQNMTSEELDQLFEQETERFVEDFFDCVGCSPIGRLLEIISAIPAIREEKVFDIRRQISEESYDIDRRFDSAMEKVFEEYMI